MKFTGDRGVRENKIKTQHIHPQLLRRSTAEEVERLDAAVKNLEVQAVFEEEEEAEAEEEHLAVAKEDENIPSQ